MPSPIRESQAESYRLSWRDRLPRPLQALSYAPWWQIALAGLIALLLGHQMVAPNSRVIKALAGLILFLIAIRSKPFWTLCFITLLFPFPFSIFVGSSTMIFIVLAALIYLGRLTLGQVPKIQTTPVDAGLGILLVCYVLSFYNVNNPVILQRGLINMFAILASFVLFYMTANLIRTEGQLKTFVRVLAATYAICVFVALFELFFPNRVLIPHWILDQRKETLDEYYRVSGPFYDFELFAEFMAMGFFLALFLYRRATSPNARFFAGVLTVLTLFVLFSTVTRGATIAFLGGCVYLLWLLRRSLKIRDLSAVVLVAITVYLGMEFVVSNFTRSGSVFERLIGTRFVGLTPDSRQHWPEVWERVLEHPVVGHGPYYDLGLSRGITGGGLYTYLWPHSQYLYYAHTVGILGMLAFLFMALRLLWLSTRDKAASLQDTSYARSLMVVLHVMFLVFLVDQTKIEHLRNSTYQYFPWIIMGLIVATHRLIQKEKSPPPRS